MDTRLLTTFLTVLRTGGMTAAAAELGFVQSTVTAHVQALERLAGTPLLDRRPGGVSPTRAGSLLAEHARGVLDLQERMLAEVAATATEPSGPVRVRAPESVCAYWLAPLLPRLRARFPDVTLSLFPAGTRTALEALAHRRADLALVLDPAPGPSGVDLVDLGAQPLSLVAAAATPLPGDRPPTPAELAAAGVLLLEEGCSYSDELAALVKAADPAANPPRFGGIETAKRCAAAGLGVALLPAVTVADELAAGTLAELPPPAGLSRHHLWLAEPASRWRSPAVRAVRAALVDSFRPGAPGSPRRS
ncbi:DNA-binding transcriptional LysR family regulator [Actinomadura coerulea]|uniref:DNA-binding transcriptional LysR family regulator n=1 Tax=Actinomadura coerulea TaxID=46159 RepID=A0A7X0G6M9_9ACTN|nr:LysR family transcriptional regulator [Actinomadura coerulea]MBB6400408.1 DNA-binding transcriptional LysR family regulator [Actinomadura coerulea]GGQ39547.1 LysR family transcriptional regulator [Actinomadura coerulea]